MKMLLAVDFQHDPTDLLHRITPWAEGVGATVDVIYVDQPWHTALAVSDPAVQAMILEQWDDYRIQNEARLGELVQTLPEAIRGRARYCAGMAVPQIVEAAAEYDAVAVGTHGRRGINHLMLGSVAERVVRQAPCPVLVLRPKGG